MSSKLDKLCHCKLSIQGKEQDKHGTKQRNYCTTEETTAYR